MSALVASISAQTPAPPQPAPSALPTLVLPPITVTADKEPAPLEKTPASVTALSGDRLFASGITNVSDAAWFAPNTFFSDLSARKISNARFRGIGSSPANPGVTTVVDGVPQLSSITANFELLDVEQVEFVRGAKSALFGRNALGGVVNVTSRRPSLTAWNGRAALPLGSNGERGLLLTGSGPIVADRFGAGFTLGVLRRDGFTENSVTGNDVDGKSAISAKGQFAFANVGGWTGRLILSGERDRDGDYTLGDLAAIRSNPFEVARDFEGRTDRDIFTTTFIARRDLARFSLTSTTGIVDWGTVDETDLDYTPFPAVTRRNREDAMQFSEELRVASPTGKPLRLSDRATVAWQAGVFLFSQNYDQDAVNTFSPFVLNPQIPFAVANHSPEAALDDTGIGVFGQATATVRDRIDIAAGVRLDRETKKADLKSFFDPVIAPPTAMTAEQSFTSASPQVSVAFRPTDGRMFYGSVARGFKAGGFNPASPAGSESYAEEQAWHLEGGVKALLMGGRVAVNAALFAIDWSDMQLNLPNPQVPAQFYISNVGGASSKGIEVDANAQINQNLGVFAAFGTTHARFSDDSVSSGVNVSGNKLPSTPAYTINGGVDFLRQLKPDLAVTARADVVGYGGFEYDDLNTARQGAYALTNIRAGVRAAGILVELWIRNAFDTKYVPVAFAYDPSSAPSGFLGEPGKPRTAGVRISVEF
jgi:iron complex outermembrane recepter protein